MAYIRVDVDEEEVLDDMATEEIYEYLAKRQKKGICPAQVDEASLPDDVERLIDDYQRGIPVDDAIRVIARKHYNRIIIANPKLP